MNFFGRKIILSDLDEITADNIVDALGAAMQIHQLNSADIEYLYEYYKGNQPVLQRTKEIRPEICSRIVENRANEIVSFKVGYLCGEPIQYIGRESNEHISSNVQRLNKMMLAESKATKDKEMLEWQHISGVGYRFVLPAEAPEDRAAPFEIYTLDPRNTFVIRSSKVGNRSIAGVHYIQKVDNTYVYYVYTDKRLYEVHTAGLMSFNPPEDIVVKDHALGTIPIIEYPGNNARLGAFEIVLPQLDALNNIASNRMDGIEQFIQSLMIFYNCQLGEDGNGNQITPRYIRQAGAIFLKSIGQDKADLKILSEQLDQTQTQVFVDYLYQSILDICGMPNRNGGSSTSDTGKAVIMRDGWSSAEARAKDSELMFDLPEREFLQLLLRICRDLSDLNISADDLDIKFTRRNYEDIQTKSQVLTTMLDNEKIAPHLAFVHCGMFSDPEAAYMESVKYFEKSTDDKRQGEVSINGAENGERTPAENAEDSERTLNNAGGNSQ